jgi:uncharacterized protein YacL
MLGFMIIMIVLGGILSVAILTGFLVWTFREHIFYVMEVAVYGLQAAVRLAIQASVALVELADEVLDLELADNPLARALIMGVVGMPVGMVVALILAMLRNQPWVIMTFTLAIGAGIVLGFVADPEGDWSLPAFPPFPGRGGGGGPQLPLNM